MQIIRWLFVFSFVGQIHAQSIPDSVTMLEEVVVFGLSLDEYAAGSSIKLIQLSESGSLQNLGNESALFFKNYGNGGLSTISLRGTSASHTNVLWNGIPVNSPTLGQSDYSVFPAFLLENVVVQKGSSGALFGSGSIGGSLLLDNSNFKKDSIATIYSSMGSFGQINGGLKLNFQIRPKLLAESRFFYGTIENDFEYTLRGEEVSQPNASIQRMGMSQKFSFRKNAHYLFAEMAYAKNDREVQPTKTGANQDHLKTENIRGVISHEHFIKDIMLISSVGYSGETTLYNHQSKTITHLLSGQYAVEFPLAPILSTRFGVSTIQTWGQSENYLASKQAGQVHVYSSFSLIPTESLRFTVNLREAFHGSETVFVPSFGVEGALGIWTFRTQLSKGYRVPTFNDRFWNPGGNPNLDPEKSQNYEVGLDLNKPKISISATAFYSKVEDWIQWIPNGGIWSPSNLKEVTSRGIELNAKKIFSIRNLDLEWMSDYEYILSTDNTSEENNQLPYVPKHSVFSSISLNKDEFSFKIRANYTGVRYTTLTNSRQSSIDDHALFDVILSQEKVLKRPNMGLKMSLNNIFNTEYENVKNTAMPRRNFLTELTIKF